MRFSFTICSPAPIIAIVPARAKLAFAGVMAMNPAGLRVVQPTVEAAGAVGGAAGTAAAGAGGAGAASAGGGAGDGGGGSCARLVANDVMAAAPANPSMKRFNGGPPGLIPARRG